MSSRKLFFVEAVAQRCFPVNFVKFLRTPFLTERFRWVLIFLLGVSILKVMKQIKSNRILEFIF